MRNTASPSREKKKVRRSQPNFAPPRDRPETSSQMMGVKWIARRATISRPIRSVSLGFNAQTLLVCLQTG